MSKLVRRDVREPAIAIVFAFLALGCRPSSNLNPCYERGLGELRGFRWIAPRLSVSGLSPGPCAEGESPGSNGRCPDGFSPGHKSFGAVSLRLRGCESEEAHVNALRLLLLSPDEIEEAVEMLEALSLREPEKSEVLTDLGAAYFVRGRSGERPTDLLRAAEASRRALELAPNSLAARFNLGLADEAVMPPNLARLSWQTYLERDANSPWAADARAHLVRLREATAAAEADAWPLAKERLDRAMELGERETVRLLIARFPSLVRHHVEQDLLGRWIEQGDLRPQAFRRMAVGLKVLAEEHRRLTEDPFLVDVVAAVERAAAGTGQVERLAAGVRALGDGLGAQEGLRVEESAADFTRARDLLRSVGCPLAWSAELGRIIELSRGRLISLDAALRLLEPVENEARRKGYLDLLARSLAHRAYCLQWQGRPAEALGTYERASGALAGVPDLDLGARITTRRVGILRTLGEAETAWREAAGTLPAAPRLANPLARHLLLSEAALTAHSLDAPRVALALQSESARLAREELTAAPAEDLKGREGVLGVALREKASFEADLGDLSGAMRDLAEAGHLLGFGSDLWRPARSRLREVEGLGLRGTDPLRAIEKFTEALRLLPDDEVGTVRATLFFERAGALEQAGRSAAVEGDLRFGFSEIQREEAALAKGLDRRSTSDFLSGYLARFRQAYELYINLLVDRGRYREAFEISERSRVFEPLTYLREAELSTREVERLARTGAPMTLAEIQSFLPRGTYVVELAVLKDRVVAWIVGRQHFETVIQKVDRGLIEGLSRRLERQVAQRLGREATETLGALDTAVFRRLRVRLHGDRAERIVVVSDGALRGVPMAGLPDTQTGRFLIEELTVSAAPSATLYVYCLLRDRRLPGVSRPAALLIGDPAFETAAPEARGLGRLEGASSEVAALAGIYGRAVVLTGERATAEAFLARAGKFQLVHYAGHAVIASPVRSFLALAPSKRESGFLYAQDLLGNLRLDRTRLVVLSACSSAGGRPGGPVEIGALVRPIFAAGAPGIVASVWSVGDDRSSGLLFEFHRRYAAGADAADALREAQLCSLNSRNPLANSILSWASFEVIGYASSGFGNPKDKIRRLECSL